MFWNQTRYLPALFALVLAACGGGSGSGGSGDDEGGDAALTAPPAPVLTLTPRPIKSFLFSWSDVSDESEYRLLENPDGMSGYSEVAVLPKNSARHTLEVSLPQRVNARYILQACNSQGCTDSEAVFVSGSLAEAVGYFKATNTSADDRFGHSIALSANGQVMAIGVPNEDDSQEDSGAVYVYVLYQGKYWTPQMFLKASNPGEGDAFGRSLALSADGRTLAVGAEEEDSNATNATGSEGDQSDNSASDSGAVYVFKQGINTWTQEAYIKASNTGAGDRFGASLSLSADGTFLAVGAPREDSSASGIPSISDDQMNDDAVDSGAVYLFKSLGYGVYPWFQQAYIKASNTGAGDLFGNSLALSADGLSLAVGAVWEDSDATGINGNQTDYFRGVNSGAVYMFTQSEDTWSQQAYIKASNSGGQDRFGESVALSSEGDVLAVGAIGEASNATGINGDQGDNAELNSGAVYVFSRNADSWSQQAYIKASNSEDGDKFGSRLALSADGSALAVSALGEDSSATGMGGNPSDNAMLSSGAVYLFSHSADNWTQQAYVKAPNTDEGDRFGASVALSEDGSFLAVGAITEDSNATRINGDQADNSASNSGAVYLY